MPKIDDLPSIAYTEAEYYDGCVLVTNGFDDSGDYVTGQITAVKIIDDYINNKIDWNSPIFHTEVQFLYATYYSSSDYYLCGLSLDGLASNIASSISENDYLYSYISSSISDYISLGYLSDYLSDFISNYATEGYLDSYITSQIGSYVNNMGSVSYTSEITGIVVTQQGSLKYVACSSAYDLIYNTVFYGEPYSEPLSDNTYIAVMGSYLSAYLIAPVTLGDIVSYVKTHL